MFRGVKDEGEREVKDFGEKNIDMIEERILIFKYLVSEC